MKLRFVLLFATATLLLTAGCKKKDDGNGSGNSSTEAPFFKPGKGFRYLRTLSANDGSTKPLAFSSCDLSVTPDGRIHWCVDRGYSFSSSRMAARYIISPSNGDTLPLPGLQPEALLSNYEWGRNAYDVDRQDRFLYQPYTGNLYLSYRSNNHVYSLAGEVPKFDYEDWSFNRHPRVYANGAVAMSFFEQASASLSQTYSRITTFLWHNGQKVKGAGMARTLWTYQNQNMDSLWHGGIGFPAGSSGQSLACTFDDHAVYLIDTARTIVHSAPFKGQPFMPNSASNAANIEWTAKTSADMKTTTLMCRDEDRVNGGFYYSTFIVDNAARTISVAVNAAPIKDLMAMDYDIEGNIYYATCPNCGNDAAATARIVAVKPGGGTTIMADDFIGRQLVSGLYARNGKLYLAVLSNAKDDYGSTIARITLLVND